MMRSKPFTKAIYGSSLHQWASSVDDAYRLIRIGKIKEAKKILDELAMTFYGLAYETNYYDNRGNVKK